MSKATELAWATGLFEGEGCISSKGAPYHAPSLCVTQRDRQVLDRFVAAIGEGKVYGPYTNKILPSRPFHRVRMEGAKKIHRTLAKMWVYLGSVKRRQAIAAYDRWRAVASVNQRRAQHNTLDPRDLDHE